ncbi:hypothetical protein OS493_034203 [Desmophyllum pertusum]|uniref:Rootletin-like coiled-coil domain-containing protein n=1 Tax=Desmophyllum pertusum TaxID=174260 RepID=A0A9W9ZIZ1_9CNID|nr:hypothetical protein OS493_034203 [Desmophyllum pertusum]
MPPPSRRLPWRLKRLQDHTVVGLEGVTFASSNQQSLFLMEDPLSFAAKHDDVDIDAFKQSGSEEDDIGYHSIGRNIKRLEDQHLNGDPGAKSPTVPTKIRDIVTKSISPIDSKMASPGFGDESRMLQSEVSRLEDLLAATRAERDEIGSKYMAVSDKFEHYIKGGTSPGSAGYSSLAAGDPSMSDSNLVQQVSYLKSKLEEEHSNYKRKLQAYQDGQQRQAQLIQKLQQKVLQYKRKCGELETSVNESKSSEETAKKKLQSATETLKEQDAKLKDSEDEHSSDLENSLIRLEEEQQRGASLQHVNNMLREQLEQATSANQQLTLDIQKLTSDWNKAREELEARDEEEQAYFANEHVRLMDMWKTMNNFRRQFNEMKSATQRDLSSVRADVTKSVRVVQGACMDLDKNLRGMDANTQSALEEERARRQKAEEQLREKVQEFIELQNKYDNERTDLMVKVKDLTNAKEKLDGQIKENEQTNTTLRKKINGLENGFARQSEEWETQSEASIAAMREEAEILQSTLREITFAVRTDADNTSKILGSPGGPEIEVVDAGMLEGLKTIS